MHFAVDVMDDQYEVTIAPDRLGDGADAHVDHAGKVIWVSPDLSPTYRTQAIVHAISVAWRDRVRLLPVHARLT